MQSKSHQELTQTRLKELLHYDPETGVFTWRVNRGAARVGGAAGHIDKEGYAVVGIFGKLHYCHRLAFLWMTGAWPACEVDHVDGRRDNNRWNNLRNADRKENLHNLGGPYANNKCGFLGVHLNKESGRFAASIRRHGKLHHLGLFPTAEAAHAAYLKAKDELHPTHRRLRGGA